MRRCIKLWVEIRWCACTEFLSIKWSTNETVLPTICHDTTSGSDTTVPKANQETELSKCLPLWKTYLGMSIKENNRHLQHNITIVPEKDTHLKRYHSSMSASFCEDTLKVVPRLGYRELGEISKGDYLEFPCDLRRGL